MFIRLRRGTVYVGAILSTLLLGPTAGLAETLGSSPPTLSFAPTINTQINFTGVGAVGSTGNAQIVVTATGGAGSGSLATTSLNCTVVGNAAFFTVNPQSSNFLPGASPVTLALGCVADATPRTGTLSCVETQGSGGPQNRSWPLNCPAGIPNIAPNLSYQPTAGSPVVLSVANPTVGATATGTIRVTPSGGSGSGAAATSKIGQCTLSNETVPGTFGGFQGTLTFVGSTTTAQNFNLTATVRNTAVTATLTCIEEIGAVGGPGSITQRSWPLQTAAGQTPARLSLSKTASAGTVAVDSDFSYTITVGNDSSSAQTGLVVLDDVPQALTVLGASGAGWNCSVIGNAVDCRRNTLAAGASASLDIQVSAPSSAQTVVNTARATSVESRLPITSTATVNVVPVSAGTVNLRLDKRDSADPVLVGTEFSYTLEVQNLGTTPATGVVVTDNLPAGLTLIAASGTGWTCSGSSSISCSLNGALAAGASSSIQLQVRAPTAAASLTNTAQVSSNDIDSDPANNTDSESTRVNDNTPPPPPRSDLSISGVAVPASAVTGQSVDFRVTASNLGPDANSAVRIDGTLSAALSIVSASGTGFACNVSGQTVSCQRAGSFAANLSADITVRATVRPGSTAAATADFSVAGSVTDPVSQNNSTRINLSYQSGGSDLSISMADSVDPVRAGAEFTYTINVSNAGPEAASGVRVSDTLPAALTFVSASGAGYTCTRTAQTVTCTLANALASGASASFVITVRAPTTGQTLTNSASVGANGTDPNPANNTASQSTRINDRTAEDLVNLLNPSGTDPVSRAAIPVIAAECARPTSALAEACREIIRAADEGRNGEVGDALRAIAPDEVLAQSLVLREIGATQFFNVDARLNELRRGGGGFSLSGLTVTYGDQTIPVALVGDALREALGFGSTGDGLISPWGFFINGNIGTGDQDLDFGRSRVGVGYDSRGVTAGVDYRFSNRTVVGGAIGYASYSADVNVGSSLDSKSLIFTGYGSHYVSERFYVDSRLSYGNASLDQERMIRFQLGSTLFDAMARGETDATQLTVASSMGYHLNYGAWSVTPSVGLRYTSTDVDGFDETGADEFNVGYSEQSFDSVHFAAGVQVARAVSMNTGVLMPQFDISLNSESGDDPSAEARLINGGVTELFRLQEESPDSSYGTAGLGFVYLMGNGKQAYMSYRRTFGYDSFDRGTLNVGGRFEF